MFVQQMGTTEPLGALKQNLPWSQHMFYVNQLYIDGLAKYYFESIGSGENIGKIERNYGRKAARC